LAMNHAEQLILYTAHQLDEMERLQFEKHLADCAECQADLKLWKVVAEEIVALDAVALDAAERAPVRLAERALEQIHRPPALRQAFRRVIQLLRSQALLVQREMWPATASVMALGVIIALVSKHDQFIYFAARLIAAVSCRMLLGREHDTAYVRALSTPVAPW